MENGLRLTLVILTIVHFNVGVSLNNLTGYFLREDALLNFTQLARKYGQSAEEYDVLTEDGYLLKLFRIPGFRNVKRPQRSFPILMMHGITDSADTWIIRGEDSLAITLADAGYDVWCGNVRGNRYSRRHIFLNPDTDPDFWDFTFNEHGIYDLASFIDFVLLKTGALKLNAIGHSQGTTIFFVLGSTKTEYNQKVNAFIALAPVCYLQNVPKPLATLIKIAPELYQLAKAINYYELPGETLSKYLLKMCAKPIIGYIKCVVGLNFPITGYDSEQYEPSFLRVTVGHFPTGTSAKNAYHFSQVGRRRTFAQFDYGPLRNMDIYNSKVPPNYKLANVTIPTVLLVGRNDYISVVKDVALLRVQLPNVLKYSVIDRPLMNHIDFIWGRNMKDYLFPYIFRALHKYG